MFAEYCLACRHVLDQRRRVRYVTRDLDDWIFSCGCGDHGGTADWGRVHTRHLLEADPSLRPLTALGLRDRAARYTADSEWLLVP